MTDDAWKRLGELLVARRVDLGHPRRLTWARDVLGLSNDRIQSDLENGRRSNYDNATLAQVEQQYQWAPGSIRAVLGGGDPTPIGGLFDDEPSTHGRSESWLELQQLDRGTLDWRIRTLRRRLIDVSDELEQIEVRKHSALAERKRIREQLYEAEAAAATADDAFLFPDLHGRQAEMLAFIKDHLREYGEPPSMRQIGAAVGLQSSSSVATELRALEQVGALDQVRAELRQSDELLRVLAASVKGSQPAADVPPHLDRPTVEKWLDDDLAAAARRPGSESKGLQNRRQADAAGEPETDDPTDLEPR